MARAKSPKDTVRASIREARSAAGLTQEDLAEASGLSLGAISRIERGERSPTLDSLVRISEALGLEVADLIQVATQRAQNPSTEAARLHLLISQMSPAQRKALLEIARVLRRLE